MTTLTQTAFEHFPRERPAVETPPVASHTVGLLDLVGNTPLIRLRRIVPRNPRVAIYAKAEWANPGGSVKDRPAKNMLLEGERSGRLRPGKVILDATSGNTGIAYAMLGAAMGYEVHLCLPLNANEERKQLLKAYGATLTPYGGANYSSAAGETAREAVNQWIRTSGTFDGVVDFDQITHDPANPTRFNPQYDSGDHLHPNDAGYKAMGGGIDLKLFQ